jgi:hypothetical protein
MIGKGTGQAHLEVITINLVCESCGETNPPGTEFCTNCNSYLAWDRSVLVRPPEKGARPISPVPPAPPMPAPPINHPTPAAPPGSNDWTAQDPGAGYSEGGYPAAGYPEAGYDQGYADQGYVDQGYVDQGYGDQAYYDAGYYDGGYYQGGGGAPTLEQGAYVDQTCPTCGRVNPGTKRFCSRCGYSFVSFEAPDPYAMTGSWGAASEAAQDRAARREYRRSLPPLYRWRRVLIGVLVLVLAIVGGVAVRRDPIGMVQGAVGSLRGQYLKVAPVQVRVEPAEATAAKSDPAALVDGSVVEWTMSWAPSQESACGPAAGTGVIVLDFPATRIRQLQIYPGLDVGNAQRNLQPLPKVLGLSFGTDPCEPITLSNQPGPQDIQVDSKTEVTQLRIGIGSAYPAGADAAPLISITEVILKSFPN